MSFWGGLLSFVGTVIRNALGVAAGRGLTDALVKEALSWVKVAAGKELDNSARREFVVAILVAKGIPESVARLAVELAVQIAKHELTKV